MNRKTLYTYLRYVLRYCQKRKCEFGGLLNELAYDKDTQTKKIAAYINRIVNYYKINPKEVSTVAQLLNTILESDIYNRDNDKDSIIYSKDQNIYYLIYNTNGVSSRFDNYVI